MNALKVQVERVVRLIRASNPRKDRMRDELLAHLTFMFEEELARTKDSQAAISTTLNRFGDTASLARELQASVPWLERWAFFSISSGGPMRRRLDESPVRYILRTHCYAGTFGAVFYALAALVVVVLNGAQAIRLEIAPISPLTYGIGVAVIQCVGLVGLGLISEGIRRALENRAAAQTTVERQRSTRRIVGYALLGSAVCGCSCAGLMLLTEFVFTPFVSRELFWWLAFAAAVVGLPLALAQATNWQAKTRRFETWESLDLDAHRAA